MIAHGVGTYVLHTFALSFLISAVALWAVGIETRGRALEEINKAQDNTLASQPATRAGYA